MPRDHGLSDAKLGAVTGKSAAVWFEILDAEAATRLSHDQIVALLTETYEAPEWGAQAVAVRYEQDRGMRLPGQQPDGTFEVRVSRSIRGSRLVVFDAAIGRASAVAKTDPVDIHRTPERTSAAWPLSNGDLLVVSVTSGAAASSAAGPAATDRFTLTLTQSRIRLPELVAQIRRTLEKVVVQVVADTGP